MLSQAVMSPLFTTVTDIAGYAARPEAGRLGVLCASERGKTTRQGQTRLAARNKTSNRTNGGSPS